MIGKQPFRDFLPPVTYRTRLTDLALVVAGCAVLWHGLYWVASEVVAL